ncbi:hypothetical protein [Aliarcobacter cryaerophilus]|uniref:hypothetical protein n=1 Tax=Aliarcobacter cryaerophilus TaxID=28198 RepID=UPI003DA1E000
MEIEREENIFYNLIKNETSLTEVFCNFMRYESFRNLFIDMINEKIKNKENIIDKSKVKFQDFDTEVALNNQKNGRIDFQLKINTNKIYLFEIKIKTYTNLTDNQPKGYLDYLKELELESENLFFILPKGYLHLKEIKNHNIIYWEDILDQLRKQELDKVNVFINEFCEIIDLNWFYFEKIDFPKSELELIFNDKKDKGYTMIENVSIPVLMNKLFQIIVDTANKKEIYINYKVKQNSNYFGYFLENSKYEISDKLVIWFGIDYKIWEIKRFPIIIQIEANEREEDINLEIFLENKIEYTKFEYEDGDIIFYIPLEKGVFENEDKNITEELTHKINEVINVLKDYK